MDLDHLFICLAVDAPEAEALIALGLIEGSPNQHPGQGTANRRFFFHNAFLELVWVSDPAEAQSDLVRRIGLWERWSRRGRGASPFGIGLRPSFSKHPLLEGPNAEAGLSIPFPTWEYRPPYLPVPLAIQMGTNSDLPVEPLLFHIDFGHRPGSDAPPRRQPLSHAQPWKEITRVRIVGSQTSEVSPALRAVLEQCPWLSYELGSEDLLEIGFDEEMAGQRHDLRPVLPLIFSW